MRIVVLLLVFASYLPAATFMVTNTNDAGAGSLRQAIIDANGLAGADIIDATGVQGVIALLSPLPDITSEIVFTGPGPAVLSITRAPFAPQNTITGTLFNLVTAMGASLTLTGLRFEHGQHLEWRVLHVQPGAVAVLNNCELERTGGIENNQSLTINNCRFLRNSGLSYGVILQDGPEDPVVTANNSLFQFNTVHAASTGIHDEAGVLEERAGWAYFNNCELLENSARGGAGAIRAASHLRVRDSLFRLNTTLMTFQARGGGAIRLEGQYKEHMLERCWFDQNQSYTGGALCVGYIGSTSSAPAPLVLHCCMSANVASLDGGGVWTGSGPEAVQLKGCTLSGNQAGRYGGGVTNANCESCTITLNHASDSGGGMYSGTSVSSVFSLNTSPEGPDVYQVEASGGYNFFGVAPLAVWSAVLSTPHVPGITDIGGTLTAPMDAMLGPLQHNGGPTPTHMPLPGSPLIDRGGEGLTAYWTWPGYRGTRLLVDARGLPRVVDIAAVANIAGGDGRDTGAVEVQMPWSFAHSTPEIRLAASAMTVPSAAWRLEVNAPGLLVASVPAPFEVSSQVGTGYGLHALGGTPGPSVFFVRYCPQAGTSHSGTLILRGQGGLAQHIPLLGRVAPAATPGFIEVTDGPVYVLSHGIPMPPPLAPMGTEVRVSGNGLTVPITINVPLPFQVSFSPGGDWTQSVLTAAPTDGFVPLTTVFIRALANPLVNPLHLTAVSTGAATQSRELVDVLTGGLTFALWRNVIQPSDGEAAQTLEFTTSGLNIPSEAQSVVCVSPLSPPALIAAIRVEGPFEISATPDAGFATFLPASTYTLTTPLYVRYLPTAGTSHRGRLYVDSPPAMPVEAVLIGVVQPAGQIYASVPALTFDSQTGPATALSFTVSGTGLTEPILISFPRENYWAGGGAGGSGATLFRASFSPSGPWGRHLTTPMPVGGVVPPTTVYVYFEYSSPPPYSETFAWRMDLGSRNAPTVRVHNICAPTAGIRPHVRGLRFRATVGTHSSPQSYFVQAVNAGPVTVTAPPHFEVSLSATSGFAAALVLPAAAGPIMPPTQVWVRYVPTGGTSHSGLLGHSGSGVQTVSVGLAGDVLAGFVEASAASLSFATDPGQTSVSHSYTVTGYGLTAPIDVVAHPPFEVSLAAGSGFGNHVATLAPVLGHVAPTTIYVRYNPAAGQAHGGTILHTSTGATPDTVFLNGATPEHVGQVNAAALTFTTWGVGVPSAAQSYVLTGVNAAGPITVSAPPHFEVSLTPGTGFGSAVISPAPVEGVVGPLTVYARYHPTAGLLHNGAIEHAGGVGEVLLPVSGTVQVPTLQATVTSLQFSTMALGAPSVPQSYSVSGFNLLSEITVAVPAAFEVSLSAIGPWGAQVQSVAPAAGVVLPFDVFVRYHPLAGTSHIGQASHDSLHAASLSVSLTGDVVPPPQLVASIASLSFATQSVGAISAEQSYYVSGSNLLGTVTILAAAPFEVSLTSGAGFGQQVVLAPIGGVLAQTPIFVRYTPQTIGPHTSTLQHTTAARAPVAVALLGAVNFPPPPVLQVSATTLSFETVAGTLSLPQSYTVSGTDLSAAVTIAAPLGFEVSMTPDAGYTSVITSNAPIGGTLTAVVYIRYKPVSGTSHTGNVSHNSTGAAAKYVAVEGRVIATLPNARSDSTAGCAAGGGALGPLLLCLLWRRRRRT